VVAKIASLPSVGQVAISPSQRGCPMVHEWDLTECST
jgi:hypothetical protein